MIEQLIGYILGSLALWLVIRIIPLKILCKIEAIFAWYDFWIGLFVDPKRKVVYIFFIPMLGFKITYIEDE